MRWPWSTKPSGDTILDHEPCEECGLRPAQTIINGLFLCGGCAYHDDDGYDDEPPDWDGAA